MQQPYIHNDTEFIGNVKILITDRDANILNADENVYVFFSVSKSKSSELIRALDLLKYVDEIRVISSQRKSFSLIMKNSCGYFNAVFTVISGTNEGISMDLMLFKSCETDTVLTAASLSADSVFRYEFKTKKMFLYSNRGGEFAFTGCMDDFEKYFWDHRVVHIDDAEKFKLLCSDIRDGKRDIHCELRLSESGCDYSLYSIRARTAVTGGEESVMGLIANIDTEKGVISTDGQFRDFEKEITEYVFDIADSSADADEAIQSVLTKTGKHFGTERVYLLETSEMPFSLTVTHSYFFSEEYRLKGDPEKTDSRGWSLMLSQFDRSGMIRSYDYENNHIPDVLKAFSLSLFGRAKSVVYCSIKNNGKFGGVLCIESFKDAKSFSDLNMGEIKTVSRIISSYLFKLREYRSAKTTIDRLTNYDKLTGMPNLNRFKRIAEEALRAEINPESLSLIYYDINNFKYINEKYGEESGDRLLIDFAESIAPNNRETVFSCRVFSDKFVQLVRCSEAEVEDIAISVINSFVYNEQLKHSGYKVTFSCGFYTFRDKETDINIALDNVTLASKSERNIAETTCVRYRDDMRSGLRQEIEMLNNAMKGLINREFVVYYQPKVALENSHLVGGEALVRWKKPDGTMIPPNDFIPCLEKNGFITALDFYVYEEVCRFIKSRVDKNLPIVPISVNVSMLHLKEEGFLDRINSLVKSYAIPANLLEFELTEGVFLENEKEALKIMEKMKEMGFLVSIDDFGSGFSSLNLLKNMPVDILKIDKEFFAHDTLQNNDQIIISSIINMANRLHISVICEGVETVDQVHFLKETCCDMVQGYFYSKPVDEDMFRVFNSNTDFRKENE